MQTISFDFNGDSPTGYAVMQYGDHIRFVVNMGRVAGLPTWLRELIANEVAGQVGHTPDPVAVAPEATVLDITPRLRLVGT